MIRLVPLLLTTLLLVACATKKIDWATRLDNYTYDQAVVELGPPDKSARLSDGTTIAEWYQRRQGPSVGLGVGVWQAPVGVGIGVPVSGSDVRVLRLTFDPSGVL